MRQLVGALWMYLNMDGYQIIQEIHNLGVWGSGIWELQNSAQELQLYKGYKKT